MKVLMLGWEFPPYISGGLGTACYGLTQGLSALGTEITFVLPHSVACAVANNITLMSAESPKLKNVTFRSVDVHLYPYANPGGRLAPVGAQGTSLSKSEKKIQTKIGKHVSVSSPPGIAHYGGDMFSQVHRYAELVSEIAEGEEFDVIHAHDWMTYPAAIAAAELTHKPLVVHVHSTEHDRSGVNVNDRIYHIERKGMHRADHVIAVSRYTQQMCVEHYNINASKIQVVYNAIQPFSIQHNGAKDEADRKTVLFLGRITMQKGPEYFLLAAKRTLEVVKNVRFIMAGNGDMFHRMVYLAAELGIGHKVHFPGFMQGDDVDRMYRMADLYVMPSVSEPFGIAPLEAITHDVPVMISKQSGVSEVLGHVLKVDFWDIDEMANKIIAVLKYPALHKTLRQNGSSEVKKFNWTDSAKRCIDVYKSVMGKAS
jgi:glycosyltransferase involved in cell wall biosynthesis